MLFRRGFPVMPMVAGGVAAGAVAFLLAGEPGPPAVAAPSRPPPAASAPVTSTPATSLPPATAIDPPTTPPATNSTTVAGPVVETSVPRSDLVIQAVGDVNFDPTYITTFVEHGYEFAFSSLDGAFLEDDVTVVNLECPPTAAGTQVDKAFSFACDPDAMPVAAANGVDVANLANNHGQDRGADGLLDALEVVRAAGMAPVGAGADLAEATAPVLFRTDGWTVAVLGMGGVVPGDHWLATDDRPGMASGDDLDQMVAAVSAAAEQADLVVVTIHWGRELVAEPDPADRERAAAMIAAGADVIFGHHAHRLGALQVVDGAPVFWTLGNFIWPRLSDAGATTAVARVEIDAGGAIEACLVPAFIEESGRPELRGELDCGTP